MNKALEAMLTLRQPTFQAGSGIRAAREGLIP